MKISASDYQKAMGVNQQPATLENQLSQAATQDNSGGLLDGLTNRAKSVGNAFGTTGAAIGSLFATAQANKDIDNINTDFDAKRDEIVKNHGFNSWNEFLRTSDEELDKRTDIDTIWKEIGNAASGTREALKKQNEDYKNNWAVEKVANTDRNKFAGDAITTLSTMADVMLPGVMNNPIANTLQGGLEGVAQELSENGENASLENMIKNATTGMISSGVTAGVGNKLKAPKGILGSAVRGAEMGALGGATSGAVGTYFNGGDLLENMRNGAAAGAQSGAATGAVMPVVNAAISKTPGLGKLQQKIQEANADVAENGIGGSFKRAAESGDSVVANAAGKVGNRLKEDAIAVGQGFKDVAKGTGALLRNAKNNITDRIDDWQAGEDQGFGPQYNKYTGDPESAKDYLMRRQQGEVPGAAFNQSLQDNNGDGMIDFVYGQPGTGEEYKGGYGLSHIQAKHGQEALDRVPYNVQNGAVSGGDTGRVYLTNGQNNDKSVIRQDWDGNKKQWLATNFEPELPAPEGAVSSPVARTSDIRDNAGAMANSNIPQRSQNVNLPDDIQNMDIRNNTTDANTANDVSNVIANNKLNPAISTSKNSTAENLRLKSAQALLDQYGTIDKPMARSANALENVQKVADAGFKKPGDVERMVGAITGANGEVTKLTRNLVSSANDVDTWTGIDNIVDEQIRLNGLSGTSQGDAVKSTIEAQLNRLSSRKNGTITGLDDPNDTFDVIKALEKRSADLKGKSGNNYRMTTPERTDQAKVIDSVANTLKDRLYSGSDISKVLTPEVAADLKQLAPNNSKWADYVDNTIMTSKDIGELRSSTAPFVNMGKVIENQYMNYGTAGQQMGTAAKNASKIASTLSKAPLVGQLAGAVADAPAFDRLRASAYEKMANIVDSGNSNTKTNSSGFSSRLSSLLGFDLPTVNLSTAAQNAWPAARSLINSDANIIQSNIGTKQAQEQQNEPQSLEDMLAQASTTTYDSGYSTDSSYNNTTTTQNTNAADMKVVQLPDGRSVSLNELRQGMINALAVGDTTSYNAFYKMASVAEEMVDAYKTQNNSSLSASEKNQLAKLDSAENAINQLEQLFDEAGGGRDRMVGNLQNFLSSMGKSPKVAVYNSMAQGLINQIGAAIGKTDSLNTEGEVKRALELIPQFTDTAEEAKAKLETLRRLLAANRQTYQSIYGVYTP